MFGTLDRYQEKSLFEQYPCFYIYLPDGILEYRIVSCYAGRTGSVGYTYRFPKQEDFQDVYKRQLPDCVDFKEIIEPLRDLFKDEVRKAGLELGIPKHLVFRQPFPGPGLGIRIVGEVTEEKVKMVQNADAIYREEIANAGLDKSVGQYFAALTNMRSVGVMGDERTYDYAVALRAVNTIDFMTAEAAEIPWEVLHKAVSYTHLSWISACRIWTGLPCSPLCGRKA